MTSSGTRSSFAQATPLTTEAAPGPSVVMHAPGAPVISACAIAAIADPVSVAVKTNGRPARPAACIRSRFPPPPGRPNNVRTPASRIRSMRSSATPGMGRTCYFEVRSRKFEVRTSKRVTHRACASACPRGPPAARPSTACGCRHPPCRRASGAGPARTSSLRLSASIHTSTGVPSSQIMRTERFGVDLSDVDVDAGQPVLAHARVRERAEHGGRGRIESLALLAS